MASFFLPLDQGARGFFSFVSGIKWLTSHPRYLLLLFLPMFVSIVLFVSSYGFFLKHSGIIMQFISIPQADNVFWTLVYWLAKGVMYVFTFIFLMVSYMLLLNVISSPIYDFVSAAVERDLTDGQVHEINLWQSIMLIKEELKKALFIAAVSLGVLVIPGVNVLSPFITAFLVGWDFYDFTFARKGWTFQQRLVCVIKNPWSVMGLGVWLMIPGVQLVIMPLAVAGGTILAVEDLRFLGTSD